MGQAEVGVVPQRRVVDIHAHMTLPVRTEWAKGHGAARVSPPMAKVTPEMLAETHAATERSEHRLIHAEARITDMDAAGVDVQVITSSSVHCPTLWAPPTEARDACHALNEAIAVLVSGNPHRLIGLGEVPLQDTSMAVAEMRRCIDELGFAGVQVSSHASEGVELGDVQLWPFWEAAEALQAVIFLHPSGSTERRLGAWQIWNSIGQPFEEAMAMASLMYEGVLDAFPRLKICIAHGGGYLPYYIGRLDRNYADKPLTRINMTRSPSEYLKFFWYDSCVYDPDILSALVRKVGADRVILGSDYPVGERDGVGFIRRAPLSEAEQEAILWKNAARLIDRR